MALLKCMKIHLSYWHESQNLASTEKSVPILSNWGAIDEVLFPYETLFVDTCPSTGSESAELNSETTENWTHS